MKLASGEGGFMLHLSVVDVNLFFGEVYFLFVREKEDEQINGSFHQRMLPLSFCQL